jgi:23S rRNA (adenine2503-C2)-methyltransferase
MTEIGRHSRPVRPGLSISFGRARPSDGDIAGNQGRNMYNRVFAFAAGMLGSPVRNLLEQSTDELADWLAAQGEPRYRADQVRGWLFERRAAGFEQMTNLPNQLRQKLADEFTIFTSRIALHRQAADGTEKLLLALADDHRIECVLIREHDRRTICISTQVGCAMGCVFCASGLDGVVRNLSTGEILEQMLHLQRLLPADERLSNIVVMGMGEPLANLAALLPALRVATSPTGLGIGARKITVSTVGLPAAMDRLTAEDVQYHLAVSLHAPDDELRSQLVPVSRNIGLAAVMAAADRFFDANRRRLTFEYVLLGGLNDQPEHARRLASVLAGRMALLNVIPYNPVAGLPYQTPTASAQERFLQILDQAGINVQVRTRKGDRIDAACGQLRRLQNVAMPASINAGPSPA